MNTTLRTNPHKFGIPQFKTFTIRPVANGPTWNVTCPDDYYEHLQTHQAVLTPLCNITTPSARLLNAATVPMHCGMFPQSREIRIASPNGARELFLLHQVAQDTAYRTLVSNEPAWTQAIATLREHMERLATIGTSENPSATRWHEATERYDLPRVDQLGDDVTGQASDRAAALRRHIAAYKPGLFERVTSWTLGLTADYALLRTHLLKLIAVLPSLSFDDTGDTRSRGREVARMAREAFRRLRSEAATARTPLPIWLRAALAVAHTALRVLPDRASAALIRRSVGIVAKRFIAGETIADAGTFLKTFYASQRDVTLDILGELVVAREEADAYHNKLLETIRGFSQHVPKGSRNAARLLRAQISVKCSALTPEFKPEAPDATYALVGPKLIELFTEAQAHGVHINIDAEHYHYRDLTFDCMRRALLDTSALASWGDVSIVVQGYLRDGSAHLQQVIDLARQRGVPMAPRLVKGAYWDGETVEAEAHNFPAPQFLSKAETDLHYRQMIVTVLQNSDAVQLVMGSHNIDDHAFAEAVRATRYPAAPVIEHQCLHGTYEALSHALVRAGYAVRNYIPIGSLIAGMGYLVRRILENSSQVGVLKISRSHATVPPPPQEQLAHDVADRAYPHEPTAALANAFRNVTPARLYLAGDRAVIDAAQPLVQPALPDATAAEAHAAIARAVTAASGLWPNMPRTLRAAIGMRAAIDLTVTRPAAAALITAEGKKTRAEALADVDETIDFWNYYARLAAATTNAARGVTAAIGPWNFPLAIPAGMASGPLLAGNTVILKPAEQTPTIAHVAVAALHRAGVPTDALQYLPGRGEVVGAALVQSPDISTVVFTGSLDVGVNHIALAGAELLCTAPALEETKIPRKSITEMGGKNGIVVLANADLDEAIATVRDSALGHAGQKCSAASRTLVDARIVAAFAERLGKAFRDVRVGRASDPATTMNPVINAEEKVRIQSAARDAGIEAINHGGSIVIDRSQEHLPDSAVGPCVVILPAARAVHPDSWAMQEIFGPIVHIIPYNTLDEAIAVANATGYALTAGVIGQSQDDIDYVQARLRAGNVYVNRSITGARVGIEPFGGFNLSGTGPKAGGPEYVEAFTLPADNAEPAIHTAATRENRRIPGQQSYNDYTHVRRNGAVLRMHRERSDHHPAANAHIACAQQLGAAVKELHGIPTAEELLGFDFLIIDGNAWDVATAQKMVLERLGTRKLLPIITPWDHARTEHFVDLRAMAVNTMRYGAPLATDEGAGE